AEAWLLIGDLQRAARETAKALQAYESAIRAAPANVKARNVYAEVLGEVGRTEEARRAYRLISSQVPENLRSALGANLLLPQLDKSRFETFVYYTNEWVGDDTRTIAAAAGTFRHLPKHPLHTVAQHVIGDELDILVYPELGMHPDIFTLAGLRLAPVQCCGW